MSNADRVSVSADTAPCSARLAVVLPVFNKEGCIRQTIMSVVSTLPTLAPNFDVIAVDDGSTDATADMLSDLVRQFGERVSVVHRERNRGYGDALRSGFAAALACEADLVHVIDADGQFDIGELHAFLPLLDRYDAIFGCRLSRNDRWLRKVNAGAWKWLVFALFGLRLHDIDCAFKLLPAPYLRSCRLHASGAVISTELLVRAVQTGLRYTEVGVHHYPRITGTPSGARLSVIVRAFKELALLRLNRLDNVEPPCSGGASEVVATPSQIRFEHSGEVATRSSSAMRETTYAEHELV
jgi:glycosyltransferase involved in cell wall biosynthesis